MAGRKKERQKGGKKGRLKERRKVRKKEGSEKRWKQDRRKEGNALTEKGTDYTLVFSVSSFL